MPGLLAKPIVDVCVIVPEPEPEPEVESAYVPLLETAGFVLAVRNHGGSITGCSVTTILASTCIFSGRALLSRSASQSFATGCVRIPKTAIAMARPNERRPCRVVMSWSTRCASRTSLHETLARAIKASNDYT